MTSPTPSLLSRALRHDQRAYRRAVMSKAALFVGLMTIPGLLQPDLLAEHWPSLVALTVGCLVVASPFFYAYRKAFGLADPVDVAATLSRFDLAQNAIRQVTSLLQCQDGQLLKRQLEAFTKQATQELDHKATAAAQLAIRQRLEAQA